MKQPVKNPDALVISTMILKKRHYIKRFENQKGSGKLIPVYTLDPIMAKAFTNQEHAFTTLDLIVPPGMRVFTVGQLWLPTAVKPEATFIPVLTELTQNTIKAL